MNKEVIQNFKLEKEARQEFKKLCEKNHTTPSHELRKFVHEKIEEFKLKLSNLRENES